MTDEEWSMQEVVKATGATSRTLRHYDRIGLLSPSRTGYGGQRFYDRDGLLRLQQILILRELEMGLADIGRVLDQGRSAADALREHLTQLEQQRERLDRITQSVRSTIRTIDEGGELVAEQIFDGFDHTKYREEVEERWGKQAYADSDAWWRSLTAADKEAFQQQLDGIVADYANASAQELDVRSDEVQTITARLHSWLGISWGGTVPSAEAFVGLGDMYVADPRFGTTFSADGRQFAQYVRDAMVAYADSHLS